MINEMSIKCFLTLARTLNFTETAKTLFISQQAVSKYISNLEEDLGFLLFKRTHHYVVMTKAGENFFALFDKCSKEYIETIEKTKLFYNDLYKSLHIGHLEWLDISSILGKALNMLKEIIPDVKFKGEKHPQFELNELFLSHKIDLIITYKEFAPKGQDVKKMKVLDTPLVLLVSPNHPKVKDATEFRDFQYEPFIKAATSRETQSESISRAKKQINDLGLAPKEIIISPNLESAYMTTEFGQGVLISTMLSRMSLNSELKCYPTGRTEELLCFWHEHQENPAIKIFAECLKKTHSDAD